MKNKNLLFYVIFTFKFKNKYSDNLEYSILSTENIDILQVFKIDKKKDLKKLWLFLTGKKLKNEKMV